MKKTIANQGGRDSHARCTHVTTGVYDQGIEPFWKRLPKFFRFPFHLPILWPLVGMSLASLAIPLFPAPTPFDFFIVEALILLAALRQAFQIMEKTSLGYLEPNNYPARAADPDRVNLPWKLLGLIVGYSLLINSVSDFNVYLGWFINLLFDLALPAAVMTLSVNNSLIAAGHPGNWWSIVTNMGKPYLALVAFLLLLTQGIPQAYQLLLPQVPRAMLLPSFNFVSIYFLFVMFSLMGYVLYQYHFELDVDVHVLPAANTPQHNQGDAIGRLIADGYLNEAVELAYDEQRQDANNLHAHDRYSKLLLLTGKTQRALAHGQRFLDTALRLGQPDKAVQILKRLREVEPNWMPAQTEQLLVIADAAYKQREADLAIQLLQGFDTCFPGHKDIPAVYMLSARIRSDVYRQDDMAHTILTNLLKTYPDHPVTPEARSFLQALNNIAARGTPAATNRSTG